MKGFVDNIEKLTLKNNNFRKVLFTGKFCQLVVMSLKPGEEIGMEVHPDVDQFFRIDSGMGKVIMGREEKRLKDGSAIVVPAGTKHNIVNTSKTDDLKLYTVYSPPNHPKGTVHKTYEEAEEYEKKHHS
ncbi:cupin domain-containing protein [Candidatus Woesebacteria bacterium]|nr:cupin domain-containing protein [Candidatus Woesebacteria bacterium]